MLDIWEKRLNEDVFTASLLTIKQWLKDIDHMDKDVCAGMNLQRGLGDIMDPEMIAYREAFNHFFERVTINRGDLQARRSGNFMIQKIKERHHFLQDNPEENQKLLAKRKQYLS